MTTIETAAREIVRRTAGTLSEDAVEPITNILTRHFGGHVQAVVRTDELREQYEAIHGKICLSRSAEGDFLHEIFARARTAIAQKAGEGK